MCWHDGLNYRFVRQLSRAEHTLHLFFPFWQTLIVHSAFDHIWYGGDVSAAGFAPPPNSTFTMSGGRGTQWGGTPPPALGALMRGSGGVDGGLRRSAALAVAPGAVPLSGDVVTGSGASYTRWSGASSPLLAALTSTYSFMAPCPGGAWEGGFGHLGSYAAGYYSYL